MADATNASDELYPIAVLIDELKVCRPFALAFVALICEAKGPEMEMGRAGRGQKHTPRRRGSSSIDTE